MLTTKMESFKILNFQADSLNRTAPANQKSVGGFVPLTRVKTLVSMTTPKDLHIQNNSILPPFIEFDMATEGFGCLYLPSLAPQSAASSGVGHNEQKICG